MFIVFLLLVRGTCFLPVISDLLVWVGIFSSTLETKDESKPDISLKLETPVAAVVSLDIPELLFIVLKEAIELLKLAAF